MKNYSVAYHKKSKKRGGKKKKMSNRNKRNTQKGGVKSKYDDYDYLEGSYKRLIEQCRGCWYISYAYYSEFKDSHLYLYGYDDFVGANKLIPIKEKSITGFGPYLPTTTTTYNTMHGKMKLPPNMPTYYYMSELVYRNNIVTEVYYQGTRNRGLREAGIRGYVRNEDITRDPPNVGEPPPEKRLCDRFSEVGIPPLGNPKAWKEITYNSVWKGKPPSYETSVSDKYIDKFLYFPKQNYKMIIIKPTRNSNIYETEIGQIELDDPENGEEWFGKEVCVVFDEFFIPPPLGTKDEPEYITSGIGEALMDK